MSSAARPPLRRRVLVAGTREVIDVAQALFGEALELVPAHSVAEALAQVQSGVDLVLCDLRFDDSRMFDFLGALNAAPALRRLPVVCCRVRRAPISAGARRGIELALEALGVAAFLDLHELEERHGAAGAAAIVRETVAMRLGAAR